MITVITGDIINSKSESPEIWLPALKTELEQVGPYPEFYEIYRGDSFQLVIENPKESLGIALKIKAAIKTVKGLDVRMAIGIGNRTYKAPRVTESNGSAFVHSGEKLELLKKQKQTLAIQSDWKDFDREINLLLRLGLIAMDHWTTKSAITIKIAMENPKKSQEELGRELGIRQNAVSNRLSRSYFDDIKEVNELFMLKLKDLL